MGVMGGVRRRCDTVTAFIFLPKQEMEEEEEEVQDNNNNEEEEKEE